VDTVKLVVVDDHALFRAGLLSLLREMESISVVGEAENGLQALEVVRNTRPDVVLLDVNMPVMNGVETVRSLKMVSEVKIIMLTISRSDDDLLSSIVAGADGYLLKNSEPSELRNAIQLVYEGKSILSPEITQQVMNAVSFESKQNLDNDLSDRELDVLACLSRGRTTAQIATELFISENTVKTHVRHILNKLEASNRAEAVSKAITLGLLPIDD